MIPIILPGNLEWLEMKESVLSIAVCIISAPKAVFVNVITCRRKSFFEQPLATRGLWAGLNFFLWIGQGGGDGTSRGSNGCRRFILRFGHGNRASRGARRGSNGCRRYILRFGHGNRASRGARRGSNGCTGIPVNSLWIMRGAGARMLFGNGYRRMTTRTRTRTRTTRTRMDVFEMILLGADNFYECEFIRWVGFGKCGVR